MELVLSLGWMVFVSWLILRAFKQRNLFPVLEQAPPCGETSPRLSVIIPARNEGCNLPRCIDALRNQQYPVDCLRIVIVDDQSTDETFAVASAVHRRSSQLTVIKSPPLPPGWVGKSHACWIGARAATAGDDWLCFMDADVQAEPDLLISTLAVARAEGLDLLSLVPRQELGSFAERLMIPCGLFLMAFWQNLAAIQSQKSDSVTASGQFILVRKAAYEDVGGHAAVRGAICEDVALALLVKKAGGRVMLRNGMLLLSARMYSGWSSLWSGISKNLVEMLGGEMATLIGAPLVFLLAWMSLLLPLADGLSCLRDVWGSCLALFLAAGGTAALFGLHIAGASYFRIPLWYGLLFPLGYAIGACLALESVRRRWTKSIVWKGRTYP